MGRIEEIRKVIEQATPGPWKWVDVYNEDRYTEYNMGGFVGANNKIVCHFGDSEQYYPTEGQSPNGADKTLIANATEYIQHLLFRLQIAEEALEWYADRNNEKLFWYEYESVNDGGKRARESLEQIRRD